MGKEGMVILGDFNGHLDILEDRKEDENGKMVMEWISTYGLILLNAEEICSGKYTWSRGEQKSAIDFVLVNENMYKRIRKMEIDEEQEVVDYSDHNLITVTMSMEQKKKEFKKNKWRKGKYYRKDGEVMGEYEKGLKERWKDKGEMEIEEICEDMVKEAEIKLKKEFRKKIGTEGKEEIEENEWITEEIRRTIKERREINRKKRNSKEGMERTTLERKWLELKYRVQGQVREEKGKWEMKMTKEIRNCGDRGKKLWQHINRLTGREKKETEVELYKEGKKWKRKKEETTSTKAGK